MMQQIDKKQVRSINEKKQIKTKVKPSNNSRKRVFKKVTIPTKQQKRQPLISFLPGLYLDQNNNIF